MRARTAATACCVALLAGAGFAEAAQADGSFESNDSLVNLIWRNSVQTATDMVSPPVNLDRRGCDIGGATILLDGAQRDRCPYIGDQAVTGMTLLVSQDDVRVLRDMLVWFAANQNDDGSIPASPFNEHSLVLVDYNAYWIESLYDYVLYTGDTALLRQLWPNLTELVDDLYPAHVTSGLLVNWLGSADYAYIPRGGTRVAYYNAQYVRALKLAASLADWYGDAQRADRWRSRAAESGRRVPGRVLGRRRGRLPRHDRRHGRPRARRQRVRDPRRDRHAGAGAVRARVRRPDDEAELRQLGRGRERLARLQLGRRRLPARVSVRLVLRAAGALRGGRRRVGAGADQARVGVHGHAQPGDDVGDDRQRVRRPGRLFAVVGLTAGRAAPRPALTTYVLGVQPTSPGFATFTVTPHPSGLTSARGVVPTPHGPIRVSWDTAGGKLSLQVTAPAGTVWENAAGDAALADVALDAGHERGRAGRSASSSACRSGPPGMPPADGDREQGGRTAGGRRLVRLRPDHASRRAGGAARGRCRGEALVARGLRRRLSLA